LPLNQIHTSPTLAPAARFLYSSPVPKPASPSEKDANADPIIKAVWRAAIFYAHHYHSLKVLSPGTLPAHGPAILICNHTSAVDPLLLQVASPRLITWMMAREYYSIRALRWFFDRISIIPVDRSGRDFAATRSAFRDLEAGRILGIFPEGRIIPGRQVSAFQTGAALIATKSGAPIFPAALEGSMRDREIVEALFYPARATLTFGPEVKFDPSDSSREGLQTLTARMHDAVARLHAQVV